MFKILILSRVSINLENSPASLIEINAGIVMKFTRILRITIRPNNSFVSYSFIALQHTK